MEKITRDAFRKWTQKNNWLQTGETPTTSGRQELFLTPAGSLVVAIYDLSGNLSQIAILGPAPTPQNRQDLPPNFLKGLPFTGKG